MRGRRRTPDEPLEIQLPITPMLDMSFQLLAFFVMTFRAASAAEGQLDLYLPAAGEARAKSADTVDLSKNSDADIDQSSDLTVVAESAQGNLDRLLIKDKAAANAVADVVDLRQTLTRMRSELGNPSNIKIEADSKLKYARLVEVMDACLKAGFRQVGFAPPPDLGRR